MELCLVKHYAFCAAHWIALNSWLKHRTATARATMTKNNFSKIMFHHKFWRKMEKQWRLSIITYWTCFCFFRCSIASLISTQNNTQHRLGSDYISQLAFPFDGRMEQFHCLTSMHWYGEQQVGEKMGSEMQSKFFHIVSIMLKQQHVGYLSRNKFSTDRMERIYWYYQWIAVVQVEMRLFLSSSFQ